MPSDYQSLRTFNIPMSGPKRYIATRGFLPQNSSRKPVCYPVVSLLHSEGKAWRSRASALGQHLNPKLSEKRHQALFTDHIGPSYSF